jgi:hypothetical protein
MKKLENRKPWITQEVLNLIDKRHKYKSLKMDEQMYKAIRNSLTRKGRKAREEWMNSVCKEVEDNISQG